jgi:hypothetical protein
VTIDYINPSRWDLQAASADFSAGLVLLLVAITVVEVASTRRGLR